MATAAIEMTSIRINREKERRVFQLKRIAFESGLNHFFLLFLLVVVAAFNGHQHLLPRWLPTRLKGVNSPFFKKNSQVLLSHKRNKKLIYESPYFLMADYSSTHTWLTITENSRAEYGRGFDTQWEPASAILLLTALAPSQRYGEFHSLHLKSHAGRRNEFFFNPPLNIWPLEEYRWRNQ